MLKETKTKYLMILDEDMEFKEHSSVQTMVSIMEHYNLDIVGGAVEVNPFQLSNCYHKCLQISLQQLPLNPTIDVDCRTFPLTLDNLLMIMER
jgi:hypothetical protein